jgi:hypothetical protein
MPIVRATICPSGTIRENEAVPSSIHPESSPGQAASRDNAFAEGCGRGEDSKGCRANAKLIPAPARGELGLLQTLTRTEGTLTEART